MKRKNFIEKGLAGIFGLVVTGCEQDNKYHFDGKIGNEEIRFYEILGNNILEVVREDYKVEYLDINEFGKQKFLVDYIFKTSKDRKEIKIPSNKEFQKEFERYLNKILEEKSKRKSKKWIESLG